jgi:hypothetical protein
VLRWGCDDAPPSGLASGATCTITTERVLNVSWSTRADVQVSSYHPPTPRRGILLRDELNGSVTIDDGLGEEESNLRPVVRRLQGRSGPVVSSASPPEAHFDSGTNSTGSSIRGSSFDRARQETMSAVAPHRRALSTSAARWSLVSGAGCEIAQADTCVTDGAGDYGNNEQCTVRALVPMIVSAEAGFSTESDFDYVTLGGTQYSGTSGPAGVAVSAGETLHWQSDGSVTGSGFTVCGALLVPPPPPLPPQSPWTPPSPPPPLSPPPPPGIFSSRAALFAAKDDWCADPTAAAAVHGHISMWDVSAIASPICRSSSARPATASCKVKAATRRARASTRTSATGTSPP